MRMYRRGARPWRAAFPLMGTLLGASLCAHLGISPALAQPNFPTAIPQTKFNSGQDVVPSFDGWIRNADGTFTITIGPRARPGNWLPTGGIDRYVLTLRLYDTPVGLATRSGPDTPMPTVRQKACP